MRLTRTRAKRLGVAAIEVVMTTALCVPAAATLYFLYEMVMNHYFFFLGNALGCPFM